MSTKIEGWSLVPEDLKVFPSTFINQLNESYKDSEGNASNNGVKYELNVVKNTSLRNVESFDIFVSGWDFSIPIPLFEQIRKDFPHVDRRIEKVLYNQKSGTLVFTLKCLLQSTDFDPQTNINYGNNHKINREYQKTVYEFAKDIEKKNGGLRVEFLSRPELNSISRIAADLIFHFKIKPDLNIFLIKRRDDEKHRIIDVCFKGLDGYINLDYLSQFMFQLEIKPLFTFNFKEKSLECQIFFKKMEYVYAVSPQEKRKFDGDEHSSDEEDKNDKKRKKEE